jgi:hypothetical protein
MSWEATHVSIDADGNLSLGWANKPRWYNVVLVMTSLLTGPRTMTFQTSDGTFREHYKLAHSMFRYAQIIIGEPSTGREVLQFKRTPGPVQGEEVNP